MDGVGLFEIYTDGGCLPNGRGAWAYVILREGRIWREDSGRADRVCNNRMEFTAATEALAHLPVGARVRVHTDSRILIESVTRDFAEWKSRGWRRKSGRPVIFPDLMPRLDELVEAREIEWRWVRAHSGNLHNESCDARCRELLGL